MARAAEEGMRTDDNADRRETINEKKKEDSLKNGEKKVQTIKRWEGRKKFNWIERGWNHGWFWTPPSFGFFKAKTDGHETQWTGQGGEKGRGSGGREALRERHYAPP